MSEFYDTHQSLAHEQIEKTREYLNNPNVQLHLGEVAAKRLVSLADRLYVPDILSGGVVVADDERIPVVSLRPGEVLGYKSDFSPEQREIISKASGNRADVNGLLRPRKIPFQKGVAVATSLSGELQGHVVHGTPVILLNNEKISQNDYTATALSHELVHAGQRLARPVRKLENTDFMHDEAQAYTIQSKLITGLNSGIKAENIHKISQSYEAWRQQGLGLHTEEEAASFAEMLEAQGVPHIHPKQADLTAESRS